VDLVERPAARNDRRVHRKVVTVLFCDVVGSTSLGETADPEAVRALLARYFEGMKTIVERHGGSVEKFIGDAVMAVFGVPAVHEDDALRACRAAMEMRETFPQLGVEGRIGVSTGEVVTGTDERLATGDAVNVAARLQQAAAPNEVLIGEATLELVRGAAETQRVEPLELKGKSQPVPAHRLAAVADAPERSHESRFVGREREIELIREAWRRAQAEQRCELLTIVGDPGIGKSRLVAEALVGVDARMVHGRCLPYGDGISYWAVVEVIKQLAMLPSDPEAAAAIRSLLGDSDAATSAEEIAWAFRKLLEEQGPLVAVFDDVQWGDETFLDLLEGMALLSAGVPVLLVCTARPELTIRRSEWPVSLRLDRLPEEAAAELVGNAPAELRARIMAAAGGNPLFLTEMIAMGAETDDVDVPPTLRALLAARLDQLDPAERLVLERGSVEGELFHRGAVHALTPEETQITPRLAALTRKDLIRPDRAQVAGDDGFRFRHLLIRDAAYDALPKSQRAELHRQFADWLDEHGADLVELDEIVGYHLEQAAAYTVELGQQDDELALRAGARLGAAGKRAMRPGGERSAAPLLERSLALTRPIELNIDLELLLSAAVHDEAPTRAVAICDAAAARAQAAGDGRGEILAGIVSRLHRIFLEQEPDVDGLERAALAALPALEEAADHVGLMYAHVAIGYGVANARGRMGDWAQAAETAIRHARAAGFYWGDSFGLTTALAWGPTPADEALQTIDELGLATHGLTRGYLLSSLGRFQEGWALALAAAERYDQSADHRQYGFLSELAALEGDYETAVRYQEQHVEGLRAAGHVAFVASYGAKLGRWLCIVGRPDEAEPLVDLARTFEGQETDWLWRQAWARVLARRGEHAEAEVLAREAIAILERVDGLTWQGDGYLDLGDVLASAGRIEEAVEAYGLALERYEPKRNLAMVAQAQERLDDVRQPQRPTT
jgi:class 3 adenylate cyclase/tetratricopeptide (TPR) repeat protein